MFSNSENSFSPTPSRGYFAFPIGTSLTPEEKLKALGDVVRQKHEDAPRTESSDDAEAKQRSLDEAWAERVKQDDERRRRREEMEREQALIGEMDWVRCGGVLRDENGRRDHARTSEIRKLVEEEDRQKRAMTRWNDYDAAWTRLLSSDEPVKFTSIPWPLLDKPSTPDDLRDPVKIAEFLFQSLKVKGNTIKKKDRLRASLLRWHPDKLGSVLAKVVEEDVEDVKEGISAVARGLMLLQEALKAQHRA